MPLRVLWQVVGRTEVEVVPGRRGFTVIPVERCRTQFREAQYDSERSRHRQEGRPESHRRFRPAILTRAIRQQLFGAHVDNTDVRELGEVWKSRLQHQLEWFLGALSS